jgi:DNA repair exonuclease SbcCD nuclease subunit
MLGMRILHTADLHLRSTDDERWDALGAILDKAEELKADALVISGDMFDRSVEAQRLKTPLREVFEKRPVRVIILPGNHDEKGLHEGDFFGESVSVVTDSAQPIDFGLTRIVGIPFDDVGPEAVLDRLLAARSQLHKDESATNVLLFHGELLDLMPDPESFGEEEGHDYMPVRLSTFSGLGFDYVLAGHFHKGYDVRQFEGGYFVYPGSPVSITRKETGRRHAVVVDAGEPPRPVPLDTAHAEPVEVRVSPFDSVGPFDEIKRRLEALHPKAAAYLSVTGYADVDAMGTTEREFDEAIKRFESEPMVAEVASRWREVGAILRNEMFKRINDHLDSEDMTDEHRTTVRNMVIDALTETLHAD